jgi:non-structural maintenance of chromosomes element 4
MALVGCEQPSDEDYAQGLRKRQIVFELDMETWEVCFSFLTAMIEHFSFMTLAFQRAIEVFNIEEPTIPTREQAKMRIGNKWYG